jgi:hypothetical protein
MKKHAQSTERKPSPLAPPAFTPASDPASEEYVAEAFRHTVATIVSEASRIAQATRKLRACLLEVDNVICCREDADDNETPAQEALSLALKQIAKIESTLGYLDLEVLRHQGLGSVGARE